MYKNMKIEINEQQPLGEVVAELERLGYSFEIGRYSDSIICDDCGFCFSFRIDYFNKDDGELTTLAELKEQLNAAD